MTHSVVLMTALVPTTGHVDLINFAASVTDYVTVVVSSRSFEPTKGEDRIEALMRDSKSYRSIEFYHHEDDNAPQNSDGSSEFWDYWADVVSRSSEIGYPITHVVASEKYGREMAEALGLEFIPYDIDRQINPITGTGVRKILKIGMWDDVTPSFRKYLSRNYVLMGQESVGKTTLTKYVSNNLQTDFMTYLVGTYPEFARPYIENAHYTEEQTDTLIVTQDMMHVIEKGQYHMDMDARTSGRNQINIQDTDLFSTEGYYKVFNSRNEDKIYPTTLFRTYLSDLLSNNQNTTYFILPDDIPVEEDPLRAEGTERESERAPTSSGLTWLRSMV